MPITFNCPQGHRLTCPDELAGKPGKCPKCGVVVRVPPTGADSAPSAAAGPTKIAAPTDEATVEATVEATNELQSAGEEMTSTKLGADEIIFLCPNGHRLHGSTRLAGRPGQCPHCGVKFLVPGPDDEDEEDPFLAPERPDAALDEFVIQIDTTSKGGSSKSGSSKSGSSKSGKSKLPSNSSLSSSAPPLATLLMQLWRHKAQGAAIEIHLGDGKLIEPDQASFKDAHHALFSTREANGAYTLTAVAWSSIERVVVRGLEQLPKEWF
jgi:hypothetical protein